MYVFALGYIIESLFYGGNNIASLEEIEDLISRRSFIQRLFPKVGIDDIRYIIYIDEFPLNFSQFVNNFVEIYHRKYCFKL